MKYFVVTSKHHDGFAMFHSKVDKYNVVDATPFGRDVVAEIGEACYKHGLKMGLYYSQDLDWHEPNGGGYLSNHIPSQGVTWENSWISRTPHTRTSISALRTRFTRRWRNFSATTAISA